MKITDLQRWWDKNERLNAGAVLQVGDRITDAYGNAGVITKIDTWGDEPLSIENHGTVNIELDSGGEEHLVLLDWQRMFRIIK